MSHIEKFWRPATAADVARVMNGETVEARFSDAAHSVWSKVTQLTGAKRLNDTGIVWLCANSNWRYCQVYDPPQWFVEKPEPGEGYRLLGKFPDEAREIKDDVFIDGKWIPARWDNGKHHEGIWYRRRIEPPKPEPGEGYRLLGKFPDEALQPFDEGLDKDGQWVRSHNADIGEIQAEGIWYRRRIEPPKPETKHYTFQVGETGHTPSGHRITITEHGVEVS